MKTTILSILLTLMATATALADEAPARRWIDQEFQPSTPVSYTHLTLPTILRV